MSPNSAFTARRARHVLLGAAVLSASVLAGSLAAPAAHAGYSTCASEPVATFSNGYVMDMDATISDDASDVQEVDYTLNVPAGVKLVSWTDTGVVGPKDKYSVNANNKAGNYTAGVTAQTATPNMNVAASTILLNATGAQVSHSSASGHSNQQLWMQVAG
jgi:hypothetical protein